MRARHSLPALLIISLFAAAVQAQTGNYKIDPVHSAFNFKNHHMGAGHVWGRFNTFAGSYTLGSDAKDSKFDITIQADSVDTGNAVCKRQGRPSAHTRRQRSQVVDGSAVRIALGRRGAGGTRSRVGGGARDRRRPGGPPSGCDLCVLGNANPDVIAS